MAIPVPFVSVQRVYFDDLDALQILHNVRFMLFIERARGELFNAMGFHWQDGLAHNPDKFHVIAEHNVRYLVPVRGEGDLAIVLRVTQIGKTSLVVSARVQSPDGGVRHAEGSTRLVRLDPGTFRPTPWSDAFRATVAPMVSAW